MPILHLDDNILAIVGKIISCIKLIDMGILVTVSEHPWGYFLSDESLSLDSEVWRWAFTISASVTYSTSGGQCKPFTDFL